MRDTIPTRDDCKRSERLLAYRINVPRETEQRTHRNNACLRHALAFTFFVFLLDETRQMRTQTATCFPRNGTAEE